MKKTIIMVVMALMSCTALFAQERERMSEEDRAKAIAERIERSAERMAKDFNLNDEAKTTFISIYTAYQQEMFATNQFPGQRFEQSNGEEEKKKLSDEEATAKIQENFTRQEQQIATMQKRLDIQKKYSEEFAKVLTPQQVLKVLTPQRGQGRSQGQRGQGDGERRGNFEGGGRGGRGGFGGPRGGFGGGPGGGF